METKKPIAAGKFRSLFHQIVTHFTEDNIVLMFIFIGVFTATVLETTGERI
jgi:hypothetical protein